MEVDSTIKSYHHHDLRKTLIEKGREEMIASGVHGLSLRQVARRSGVSHTAPYRHFNDKSELLVAIAKDGFDQLREAIKDARMAGDPIQQFNIAGKAYVKMFLMHPETMQLMFGGVLNGATGLDELEQAGRETFRHLEELMAEGMELGLFQSDVTAKELALTAWSTTHGLAMLRSANQLSHSWHTEEEVVAAGEIVSKVLLGGILKRDKK